MTVQNERNPDVLAALRAATKERHSCLDREMPLSKEFPTLLDYRDHLLTLRAWLHPLEHWLEKFKNGPQKEEYLLRSARLTLIDADLRYLSPAQAPVFSTRGEGEAPPSDDPSYRWGICYVIEGSQLGGAVLQKRLAALLAPHPLHYLGGDNTPPGPRWMGFIANMGAEVRRESEISQACEGACHAFDRIIALHRGTENSRT